MKKPGFVFSSIRLLVNSLLVFSFVSTAAGAGSVLYQSKTSTRETEAGLEIRTYDEIPEATEPCTAEESEWWKRVRQAGNDLYKKSDKKSINRFYLLLYEGHQKEYRIPLKDRPPQTRVFGKLARSDQNSRVTGSVVLSVEFRADGAVGDILVKKKTGIARVDEDVIRAARQNVFLPAIKNGAFVTYRSDIETRFSDKWSN